MTVMLGAGVVGTSIWNQLETFDHPTHFCGCFMRVFLSSAKGHTPKKTLPIPFIKGIRKVQRNTKPPINHWLKIRGEGIWKTPCLKEKINQKFNNLQDVFVFQYHMFFLIEINIVEVSRTTNNFCFEKMLFCYSYMRKSRDKLCHSVASSMVPTFLYMSNIRNTHHPKKKSWGKKTGKKQVSLIYTTKKSSIPKKFPQALLPADLRQAMTKLHQAVSYQWFGSCLPFNYKFPTFLPPNSDDIFLGWGNQIQFKRCFIYIATYISVYKTADLPLKNITPAFSNKKSFRSMGLQISIIANGAVACLLPPSLIYTPWKTNMEPTNHPFRKETLSSKPPWLCFMGCKWFDIILNLSQDSIKNDVMNV